MPSDLSKPLLMLTLRGLRDREKGRRGGPPRPPNFSQAEQLRKFGPKFDRLSELLRGPGLQLTTDPTSLAPERMIVFEVRGALNSFAAAVQRVPGLELIDEEELASDISDKSPVAYLVVPDSRAFKNIESLWQRWLRGDLVHGETPWRDVFAQLRDLRPWGPSDRVALPDRNILADDIALRDQHDFVTLEIELVFRATQGVASNQVTNIEDALRSRNGRVVSRCRIEEIAYHALLAELPVSFVREIVNLSPEGIAGLDSVMHIRPQSVATTIDIADTQVSSRENPPQQLGSPILAILDGVPVAAHRHLADHLIVDDQFGLEPNTPVADRIHGTAMASLIVHGDLNRVEAKLPRQIHVVPVLGAGDSFPSDRLIVDMIYTAVLAMRDGQGATAPGVILVNISLGNRRRPFHGPLSAWSRLLDRLAYRFGILFIVSAGNHTSPFQVSSFSSRTAIEDASETDRARGVLSGIANVMAERRLLSPGETVNGLTVGACNRDAVPLAERTAASINLDPYAALLMSNPSSALGPGFAQSVKPDFVMPGAREQLRVTRSSASIDLAPAIASRSAGLRVAAPPQGGLEDRDGYTNGTSAATALASRTCHRIHDALESTYGATFTSLPPLQKAVVLKALVAHPATWPTETAGFISSIVGPAEPRQYVRRKDNIRRFIGYGMVDADDAVACAVDRATFWAVGILPRDTVAMVDVPLPLAMSGKAKPHSVVATLAWFTPISPGRKSYRSVKLNLLEPSGLGALGVSARSEQPDINQSRRGTLLNRCWTGKRAPVVTSSSVMELSIQRDPDQGSQFDESVPFGLAVTIAMPGVVAIYDQVRQRIELAQRQRT